MLCFMLPGSIDDMFDSVVFGTETEHSGILCKVDGLEELQIQIYFLKLKVT